MPPPMPPPTPPPMPGPPLQLWLPSCSWLPSLGGESAGPPLALGRLVEASAERFGEEEAALVAWVSLLSLLSLAA